MKKFKYKNGNYEVIIFEDGTKIRRTLENKFVPEFSESCDVKVTDKCKVGCKFCYEGCTKEGKHGDLFGYNFINTFHPYTELALNGNDLDHPKLEEFLKFLKTKKVFPNITLNQKQYKENYDKVKEWKKEKLIYGIGISYSKGDIDWLLQNINLPDIVVHTIVGILGEDDIKALSDHNLKLLLLGYKNLGRGVKYLEGNEEKIKKNIKYLSDNLLSISKHFSVLSFDNLSINQLDLKNKMSEEEWNRFYMGDDGEFTFYIDLVKGEFAKDSLSQVRYKIKPEMTIDDMFKVIRDEKGKLK